VRVMLKNNTGTEMSNGKLHIKNLDPANNGFTNFLLQNEITIGPRGHTFIDVAAYNEGTAEAPPGPWIQLIIPHSGGHLVSVTFNRLPVKAHKFHLSFSSFSEIFDEVYCRLFVDSNHRLQIEEWS